MSQPSSPDPSNPGPGNPGPGSPGQGNPGAPGFVVGFNPVPMANQVAVLGSRLRSSILWTLLGAAVWSAIWWSQRASWGSPWLLVAGYAVSLVLIAVTVARLLQARRNLARIGSGPALEAGRRALVLHALDGSATSLGWHEVTAVRTAGLKVGAGPEIVVETAAGKAWSMPLSFLDALPGTIDSGVRACSGGRFGLDLSGLDSLF